MGERRSCKANAVGSIPAASTKKKDNMSLWYQLNMIDGKNIPKLNGPYKIKPHKTSVACGCSQCADRILAKSLKEAERIIKNREKANHDLPSP